MQVKTPTISGRKLSYSPKEIKKIGHLISALRHAKRLTLGELSQKTRCKILSSCVAPATIARLENGDTRSPHWRSVVRILEALGCEVTIK